MSNTLPEPGSGPVIPPDDRRLHHYVFSGGPNRGQRLPRVPAVRLLYMVRNRTPEWEYAQAELTRRGTTVPKLEVSNHAMDRASQYCLDIWRATRLGDEGLCSWLHRMAMAALCNGRRDAADCYFAGMVFCFAESGAWPLLATVKHGGRSKSEAVRMAKQAMRDSA